MAEKLNVRALAYSAAIFSAAYMLLIGILGNIGIYTGAVDIMQQAHMFFSLNILGIITGMIEGAIIGFFFAYVFGLLYNKFAGD